MFIFSERAPRAGLETLAGRIQPAGRSLETFVLDRRIAQMLKSLKLKEQINVPGFVMFYKQTKEDQCHKLL